MIKECVVLDGKVINVGPWDYQKKMIQVSPAEYDEEGNITKEAVFEEQVTNPFPEGAVIENRDFEYDQDRGWREVGTYSDPDDELAAAIEAATTLEELKDALLGKVKAGKVKARA